MPLVAVCNNKLCKNRDQPCRAGCIQKAVAEYCAGCENLICPWGEEIDYVTVSIYKCKGG